MDLKQLEYFRAIVEDGTISGAARTLHMTQPPLSYQMRLLEEELGVTLFLRGAKQITLTDAGKALYTRSESLLHMTDLTKKEVAKIGHSSTIHVGMTPTTVDRMAEYISRFSKQHPSMHFEIHECSSFELKNLLENHVIDVTTIRSPIALSNVETRLLTKERLAAMCTAEYESTHPIRRKTKLSLEELSHHRLILSSRFRDYVLSIFEERGLTCDIFYECIDARSAATLANLGLGIAILPDTLTVSEQIQIRAIEDVAMTTDVLLAWRKEPLPQEVEEFIALFHRPCN